MNLYDIDTDLVKRICEDAEGFKYDEINNCIDLPTGDWVFIDTLVTWGEFEKVYYPLLLQRAIKGINQNDDSCYFIQINPYSICIHNVDTGKDIKIFDYTDGGGMIKASPEDIDTAKESALKYIYEQETK